MSRISFDLFCVGDKSFLSDFMGKLSWIHQHDVRFPKNLDLRLKFQKMRHFWWWKNNDYIDINIFLSLENPSTYLLVKKKRPENVFLKNGELL